MIHVMEIVDPIPEEARMLRASSAARFSRLITQALRAWLKAHGARTDSSASGRIRIKYIMFFRAMGKKRFYYYYYFCIFKKGLESQKT